MDKEKYILLTIDVEDWFQVENFRPWIPFEAWDQYELRVERNVHRLLDLFDSIELQPSNLPAPGPRTDNYELPANSYKLNHDSRPKATFFVLGWLAERLPNLVREIRSRGHEVASHGYNHNLCNKQPYADVKKELAESKKLLEDITGSPISGFRAPNFSIDDDALKIAEDCGYLYDSSYNSFSLNARYGKISFNGHRKKGIAFQISNDFFELPISNIQLRGMVIPLGGGAYFRLIPFSLFSMGVKKNLKKEDAYLFYLHPWEIDDEQPRVKGVSFKYKLRHYKNIKKTSLKLSRLINEFEHCKFVTCFQYLASEPASLPV
jgi:polysaccharide deacetylase family protein (PEP-CTERM system associated)